jgi:hypothetical protein
VIGVPPPPPPTVIEAFGSTKLDQVGSNYFLDPVAGGTEVELKYNGTAYVAGYFSSMTPIGAEQTATGYEVAWKVGTNQYTVWSTDSNGNYTSNIVGVVSGTDLTLESLETSFHQDLNGDGVIGVPAATAAGTIPPTTSLASKVVSLGGPSGDGFVFAPGPVGNVSETLAPLPVGQTGLPDSSLQPADHSHDALIVSDHHDGATFVTSHLLDLTANHFIIS